MRLSLARLLHTTLPSALLAVACAGTPAVGQDGAHASAIYIHARSVPAAAIVLTPDSVVKLTIVPRRGAVYVGFVTDSVYAILQRAAQDTVERAFQVTWLHFNNFPDMPLSEAVAVTVDSIVECPVTTRIRASGDTVPRALGGVTHCPNESAPRIHTHLMKRPMSVWSTCSASTTDYIAQRSARRLFEAVVCGDAPPTFYWWFQNPRLAPGDSAMPVLPPTVRVRITELP